MERKSAQFINQQGMMMDMDRSKFNPDFIYHGMNIRLDSIDGETLMAITNEKGTKYQEVLLNNSPTTLLGVCIGYCVVNDYLVLFTLSTGSEKIYRVDKNFNLEVL